MIQSLKEIFKASQISSETKVLVALNVPRADEAMLEHFRSLGLHVSRQVGNKLMGAVASNKIELLRRDPLVAEVETSVSLRAHAG